MLTSDQINVLGDTLTPLFQYLEHEVIVDIARRIDKTMTYTRTAELMAMDMQRLGYSPAKIRAAALKVLQADKEYQRAVEQNTLEYKKAVEEIIKEIVEKATLEGNKIIAAAGDMSWVSDMSVWESNGKTLTDNSFLKQLKDGIAKQTVDEMINLTQTTGFKTISGMETIKNAYRNELDKAAIKICSGTFSQQKVVEDVIHNLAKSGLRSIDFDTGYSMQLDTAVKLAVRTGCGQISAKIEDENILRSGENLVYVSKHWGARNEGIGVANHEEWQGKVYFIKPGKDYSEEAKRIGQDRIMDIWYSTGYSPDGSHVNNPLGMHGYNCRHIHGVFFEGLSSIPDEEPEPGPFKVDGKEYDYYKMTQKLRSMERHIRALKRERDARNTLKMPNTEINSKIKQKIREYEEFCKKHKISEEMNNLYYESGTSDITKTKAYKNYRNAITDNEKNGIISLSRDKYVAGKVSVSDEVIDNVLKNELNGVRFTTKPVYNSRIRTQGKTSATVSPLGKGKVTKIEIGKQVKNTRECLIDSLLHEELEARIIERSYHNKFYTKLMNASETERHRYIDKVIERFFAGKEIDYDMV